MAPALRLVERDDLLAWLRESLHDATERGGRVIFLEGEAGVGKTSLVRELVAQANVRVLWGACDALSTPRPLGPLLDMAHSGAGRVAAALRQSASTHALFGAYLEDLHTPSLAVIEDVHWADEATLDLLRFIGRRIDHTRSLLVATHREDEVGADHPLRAVLGDLATASSQRRRVIPLSVDGVRTLAAGHSVDAEQLHATTGGNPFYVTEVLAAPDRSVPPSVRDAVLARVARMPFASRAALEAVAVEPGSLERRVLMALGVEETAIAQATDHAMLVERDDAYRFRHELARLAVAGAIAADRAADLHRRLLSRLEADGETDFARLAHHASRSGDAAAELRWATAAAVAATRAGAHREGVAQYARALRHVDLLEPNAAIGLLEGYADLLLIIDQPSQSVDAWRRVVQLREPEGDAVALAVARAQLARALWTAGRAEEAYTLVAEATDAVESVPLDPRVAVPFAQRGYMAMLARRSDEAVTWAQRAIEVSTQAGDETQLALAFNALGSARIVGYQDLGGIADLDRSREIAERLGSLRYVSGSFTNLGSALGEIRQYELAAGYLQRGIEYGTAHDLDFTRHYCTAWLARVRFEQGLWSEAEDLADAALAGEEISPISPMVALGVRGRVRARQGAAGAGEPLERAWQLARKTGDLQRLWPAAAGRAELAWLTGAGTQGAAREIDDVLALARQQALPWAIGELAFWAWRLGSPDVSGAGAAEPFAAHMRGDAHRAAAAWEAIGCPYEAAWALADSGEEPAMRDALQRLTVLAAKPLAERVRTALREMGASNIPRGPRPATARSPSGLTEREQEVFRLLARGHTDREIAERLVVSPKTVAHHVSAILGKLGVRRRTEAAARATEMGLNDDSAGEAAAS